MTRMKKKYVEEVAPALMEKFQYKSVMQIPKIDKIVVSVGCGDCKDNAKALDNVIKEISAITGQHAVATVARKSVANFKLREGCMSVLRSLCVRIACGSSSTDCLTLLFPVFVTSAVFPQTHSTAAATTAWA